MFHEVFAEARIALREISRSLGSETFRGNSRYILAEHKSDKAGIEGLVLEYL